MYRKQLLEYSESQRLYCDKLSRLKILIYIWYQIRQLPAEDLEPLKLLVIPSKSNKLIFCLSFLFIKKNLSLAWNL